MGHIADLLKDRREALGLRICEAADLVGVRWNVWWTWETGRNTPRNLDAVLKALQDKAREDKGGTGDGKAETTSNSQSEQ